MVEWKKLNTVCEVINGRAYKQQELLANGKYRVLRVGNFFSNDSWYYSDLELDDKYYCQKGDLLYAWSASFGPHIWNEEKTIYHYHIWKMNCFEELDKKFMFYWLQSEGMRKQAFSHLHGATMAHLTKVIMESLSVPLLPLSEQNRIVCILDTFTDSIENLKEQIEQRKKQYEYYCDQLLFSNDLNAIASDVSSFAKGRISAEGLNASNYVSVENLLKDKAGKTVSSVVPTEGNWLLYQENDILIGNIRPYLRKIWFADVCGGTNGDVLVIRPNEKVIPRFLYSVFSSERFFNYYNQTAKGGKMPRGEKKRALQFDFYLPSIEEQSRIVAILDKFEASIANLEQQLAQRQKQYEYYRNKLLTFE